MRTPIGILTLLAACTGPVVTQTGTVGAGDDYYSNVAREYEVTGRIPLAMTADDFYSDARSAEIATRSVTAAAMYLNAYLVDKDAAKYTNAAYGGFHTTVRNRTATSRGIIGSGGSYFAELLVDVAGPDRLFKILPGRFVDNSRTKFVFDFQMPKKALVDPDHVPGGVHKRFDPSKLPPEELETVTLTARALANETNAYPRFDAFVDDGVYELTLFYGHDYNESRSDLSEAESAFDELLRLGFTAPDGVATFADLGSASGAFYRTATANGVPIWILVSIFHSNMFVGDRKTQKEVALEELTQRDVFFYNGHAGPYYGLYLDPDDEAYVSPEELSTARFDDHQQLFIGQGCRTYSQYADVLYENPEKSEDNLDVVTTVNFSYGDGTLGLLGDLVHLDGEELVPVDYAQIIRHLNSAGINAKETVLYGVIGMDDDPRLHPYATVDSIGLSCSVPSDCGSALASVCAAGQCGVRSLDGSGCPSWAWYDSSLGACLAE